MHICIFEGSQLEGSYVRDFSSSPGRWDQKDLSFLAHQTPIHEVKAITQVQQVENTGNSFTLPQLACTL